MLAIEVSGFGAARMPGDIPVDPLRMKYGESACVFPVHFTAEGNIWISLESVYRRSDRESCILKLSRMENGWRLDTYGIPIFKGQSHDSELHRFGWIKLGVAAEVMR